MMRHGHGRMHRRGVCGTWSSSGPLCCILQVCLCSTPSSSRRVARCSVPTLSDPRAAKRCASCKAPSTSVSAHYMRKASKLSTGYIHKSRTVGLQYIFRFSRWYQMISLSGCTRLDSNQQRMIFLFSSHS